MSDAFYFVFGVSYFVFVSRAKKWYSDDEMPKRHKSVASVSFHLRLVTLGAFFFHFFVRCKIDYVLTSNHKSDFHQNIMNKCVLWDLTLKWISLFLHCVTVAFEFVFRDFSSHSTTNGIILYSILVRMSYGVSFYVGAKYTT